MRTLFLNTKISLLASILAIFSFSCDMAGQVKKNKTGRDPNLFKIGLIEPYVNQSSPSSYSHPSISSYEEPLIYSYLVNRFGGLDLAENLLVSDDKRECVVKLRKGVLFHNGSTLTADDVVYSFNEALAAYSEAPEKNTPFSGRKLKVEKLDDLTVSFKSKTPRLFTIDLSEWPIISEKYEKERRMAGGSSYSPNGTGPYKYAGLTKSGKITKLARFERYFEGAPRIKKIELWRGYGFEEEYIYIFGDGLDYIPDIGIMDKWLLNSRGENTTFMYPAPYCFTLIFNSAKPAVKDWRIRKALSLLVDRQTEFNVDDAPAESIIPTSQNMSFSHPKTEPFFEKMDYPQAMRLFNEAGYKLVENMLVKNGKPLKIRIAVYKHPNVLFIQRPLQKLALTWQIAGVDCQYVEFKHDAAGRVDAEAFVYGIKDSPYLSDNAGIFLDIPGKTSFGANFSDPALEKLFREAENEIDESALLEKKRIIQERLKQLSPIIPLLYTQVGSVLYGKRPPEMVKSISKDPVRLHYLSRLR